MELSRGVQVARPVSEHGGAPGPDRDIVTQFPEDRCKRLSVWRQVDQQPEIVGLSQQPEEA